MYKLCIRLVIITFLYARRHNVLCECSRVDDDCIPPRDTSPHQDAARATACPLWYFWYEPSVNETICEIQKRKF